VEEKRKLAEKVLKLFREPVKYQRTNVMIRRDYLYMLKVIAARYNKNVSRLLNEIIENAIIEDIEMMEVLLEWHEERRRRLDASR
jgi:hypothetical protein